MSKDDNDVNESENYKDNIKTFDNNKSTIDRKSTPDKFKNSALVGLLMLAGVTGGFFGSTGASIVEHKIFHQEQTVSVDLTPGGQSATFKLPQTSPPFAFEFRTSAPEGSIISHDLIEEAVKAVGKAIGTAVADRIVKILLQGSSTLSQPNANSRELQNCHEDAQRMWSRGLNLMTSNNEAKRQLGIRLKEDAVQLLKNCMEQYNQDMDSNDSQ